jgi:DNA-binding MarR family transcriptional regulator
MFAIMGKIDFYTHYNYLSKYSFMIGKTYEESVIQGKAYRLLRARVRDVLSPYNISPPEWSVIGLLVENGELYQFEIGEYLSVEPPLVTNMINAMEKKGLIHKKVSVKDARRKCIELTSEAAGKVPEIESRVNNEMKEIFGDLGEENIRVYFEVLEHIIQKIEK